MADFAKIKEAVSIESVATNMLRLQVKKEPTSLRCECPVHGGGPRSLAITGTRGVFYCMQARVGGSCIDPVAHGKQVSEREAAEAIASHFGLDRAPTAPAAPRAQATSPGMPP